MAVTSRFPPVVVGVDGSDPATAAARVATAEARRRLLPVHLVRTLAEPLPGLPAPPGPPDRAAARRAALDELGDLRESLLREYPGGQVTTALADG